jgi:hypothetical protein
MQFALLSVKGTMLDYVVRKFYERYPDDAASLMSSLDAIPRASQGHSLLL